MLFNTCSVRELAEEKTYSAVGRSAAPFKRAESRRKIIGVIGCMAQKDQELVRQRVRRTSISWWVLVNWRGFQNSSRRP